MAKKRKSWIVFHRPAKPWQVVTYIWWSDSMPIGYVITKSGFLNDEKFKQDGPGHQAPLLFHSHAAANVVATALNMYRCGEPVQKEEG